jgi:hypothetical protein
MSTMRVKVSASAFQSQQGTKPARTPFLRPMREPERCIASCAYARNLDLIHTHGSKLVFIRGPEIKPELAVTPDEVTVGVLGKGFPVDLQNVVSDLVMVRGDGRT